MRGEKRGEAGEERVGEERGFGGMRKGGGANRVVHVEEKGKESRGGRGRRRKEEGEDAGGEGGRGS